MRPSTMKRAKSFSRCILQVTAVSLFAAGSALHAQEIVGSWQGTMPSVQSRPAQRIVVKVATKGDGSLKGTITFIDNGPDGPPLMSVKYAAPDFSFEIGGITYHGKMATDGSSIAGTLIVPTGPESTEPLLVTLARVTPETAWTYSGPATKPMAANADPSFEVATIKPSQNPGGVMFILGRRQFKAANCSATELIKIAYFVRGKQVVDGPKWISDQKWDVVAETDSDIPGEPSEAQTRVMVRKLLEQRFGLKVHVVQREFSVYAMVMDKPDKPSPKLTKSDAQDKPMMIVGGPPGNDGQQALQFANATMKEFAALMMNFIQTHLIVNETGLEGKYDFNIVIQRGAFQPSPGVEDLPDPAFVQAIQPLGLKFVMKKELLDVVVVDQLTLPSAN